MKNKIKYVLAIFVIGFLFISCEDDDNTLGALTPPSNIEINIQIIGQNSENPNGDGSGDVFISVTADNAMTYKIDYGTTETVSYVPFPYGSETKKYTTPGTNDYTITVVAYGKGGSSSVATKNITVFSSFQPEEYIVTNLTDNSSKTWVVDKDVPGHLGVGPWENSGSPEWWSAGIDEKVACCNCFYTSTFTFSYLAGSNSFHINVATPDGAFTKTGNLTLLPGIPASGDEGCYSYSGGSSDFVFAPANSILPAGTTTTATSIELLGTGTFIGYGALQKSYEIIELTEDYMYLRVQGTETGNAWYLKLKPAL